MKTIIKILHFITFNFFKKASDSCVPEQKDINMDPKEYFGFEYLNGKHEGDVVLFVDTDVKLFKSEPFTPGTRQVSFDEVDEDDREYEQLQNESISEWTYRRQNKKRLSNKKVSEILDVFSPI